ncbi:MAG: hypothetical protein PUH24_08390 [Prevotellaceae bacterium]|nr:hypothetical protein [Prevotellaceae bacterium]MDY6130972.1 hypothetical protein [Prevotella sp.]
MKARKNGRMTNSASCRFFSMLFVCDTPNPTSPISEIKGHLYEMEKHHLQIQ